MDDVSVYVAPANRLRGVHTEGRMMDYCVPVKGDDTRTPCPGPHTCDWREPLGAVGNVHAVKPLLVRTPLQAMLAREYASEAHLVSYEFSAEGVPLARQPRLRKDGLAWVRSQGFDVRMVAFMADWDTPGHVRWTPEELEKLHALWRRGEGPLATCGIYLSPKGARLFQPLTLPVDVELGEDCQRAWLDALVAVGVHPTVAAVHDWTRMMRVPNHRRASGEVVRAPFIDFTRLAPIDPPAPKAAAKRARSYARSASGAGANVALGAWAETVPAEWETAAEAAGAAIRDTVRSDWRRCYLALADSLAERGCPLEVVPAIVARAHAVDQSYPEWEGLLADRVEIARSTVVRRVNGDRSLGDETLQREYPAVAAALDATTRSAAEARVRKSLAAPAPTFVTAVEAQATIERELAEAYGVVVIAAPPGTGKTHTVIEAARRLPVITDRAAPGSRIAVSSPTHKLSRQTADALPDRSLHLFSPPSMVDAKGVTVCVYAQAARHLASGGQSVRREFCEGRRRAPCDHAATCPAKDGREGNPDGNLVTGVHGLTRQLRAAAGPRGILVVDEPGEAVALERVELDQIETARRYLDAFADGYARAIAPLLTIFEAWVRELGPVSAPSMTLHEVVRAIPHASPREERDAAGVDPATPDALLGDAILLAAIGAVTDPRSKAPPLKLASVARARSNPARAAELGRASRLLDLLWRGIVGTVITGVSVEESATGERSAALVYVNPDLAMALAHEGPVVILDANARIHLPAIAKVLGTAPRFVELHVADGAPIERTVLACGGASRMSWLPRGTPDWSAGLLSAVRAAVLWVLRDPTTLAVGMIAPLVVAAAIEHTLYPDAPEPVARWPLSKGALAKARALLAPALAPLASHRIVVGHYQALEGLNHMADCDATVTLMDPRPNLGDDRLKAEYLGLPADGRIDDLARAELEQAHGRLRTVHRQRPGRQLHVGALVPSGWEGRPVTVERLTVGRPRNTEAMTAEAFAEARAASGESVRGFAKALRISEGAVRRYESGERGVPEDVARAVTALAFSASETPSKSKPIQGFRTQFMSTPGPVPAKGRRVDLRVVLGEGQDDGAEGDRRAS